MFNLKKILLQTHEIEPSSEKEDEFERIQIATCIILLEVAKSDDEFSSIEKTTVAALLKKKFELSSEAAEELIKIANQKRDESIDLWQFTNLINKNYTKEDKIKIIEEAWKVIYADKKLDRYEDHFIHKLAILLQLKHHELIEAKLRVKHSIGLGDA
jgi:uncharacterized tellurite resistance protein B-like protein